MALAHNLDIQIERYSPQILRYELRALYGVYDPVLSVGATNAFTKYPGTFENQKLKQSNPTIFPILQNFTTNTFGQDFPYENRVVSVGPALTGLLPMGLTYDFFARSDHVDGKSLVEPSLLVLQHDANTGGLIPAATNIPHTNNYYAIAGGNLNQPVLKDFWIDRYRRDIQLSKKNLKISELALRATLMTNVTRVVTNYYELVAAREQINVETVALQAARHLLDDTTKRFKAGAATDLDQQQAEAALESIQTDLFAAEQNFAGQENALKDMLTDDYRSWTGVTIAPSEKLTTVTELPANRAASWANALSRRPDILQMQLELEKQAIFLAFTYNQLFPSLNLVGSYGWQSIEHTLSESLNGLRNGTSPFFSAGAVFAIPVANVTARNNHKASQLARERAFLRFKSLEQSVIAEVDTEVKVTENTFQQIASARKAREFAQAALESLQQQYTAGTTNSYFVVEYQRLATLAQSVEIRALANYHIAQAQLALSEGTALERNQLQFKQRP